MKQIVLFLFLFAPLVIFSQITITGVVKDKNGGETLPYASVYVKDTKLGVSTNLDGFFTLLDVPNSNITLVISYIGYNTKEVNLIESDLSQKIIISLEANASQLDEVIVSSNANTVLKANKKVSQISLSTKQLNLLPSVGEVDVFRSLQLLPGVSGTNENSSGLFVRGGTPDQNLVLLDGMTVYKVDHFFGFFSAFNNSALKDVQLYKGAFPAKYGGRTSSVVDLTGKTGSFEEFGGEAGINLLSTNAYFEVPLSNKVSFLIAGRRSYTDILRSNIFNSISDNLIGSNNLVGGVNTSNIQNNQVKPDFYFYDWNSKLSYKPNEKNLFTLSTYNGQDFLDESREYSRTFNREDNDYVFIDGDVAEKTDWGNKGISFKWAKQWSPKVYTNFLVARTDYFSKYNRNSALDITTLDQNETLFTYRGATFEDNSVQDFKAKLDIEWLVSSKHKISTGISYTASKVDYENIRDQETIVLQRKQTSDYASIYVSDEWTPNDKLSIEVGLRASNYELTDENLFSPRLSFNYSVTDEFSIKGGYGKHYQFVNRIINDNITEGSRDFWLLADGQDVKISNASHYIAGVSYEDNGWLVNVETYYKDLENLSEFSLRFRPDADFSANELFFTGDGIAKGVEFLLQKKQGNYTGWTSYTLGSVRNTFPELNDGEEFPALHDQRHEFKMVHNYRVKKWNFSTSFIYGSGKPFSEPAGQYAVELLNGDSLSFVDIGTKNGSRLPAYHRLDLSAHYKFNLDNKIKADLGVSIFNLYNRNNVWHYEYDFNQTPVLVTAIEHLGMTPNLSFNIQF